ncbi:hypothetical protein [Roseococcus sp.]|uniref:hypothetical protein n=1 Tax=Roseococcus sp. TaxID=2109646 RepID=UPI003BAB4143
MPEVIVRHMTGNKMQKFHTGSVLATPDLADQVIGKESMNNIVNKITIVRHDDIQATHWELYLEGNGPSVKVDLMEVGYRVLFDANARTGTDGSLETLKMETPKTLGECIKMVGFVASKRGDWTGTLKYNCQDFVILYLAAIGMSASQIFKYELRRFVTKFVPPIVTDADADGNIRTRY